MVERDTEKCEDNAEKCDESECILLSNPTCEIPNINVGKREPTINLQEFTVPCHSNWVQLVSLALGETGLSTTKTSNIAVQCGDDGARMNMCLISGGSSHFRLQGTSTNVKFMGLTLIGSSDVSIDAAADSSSNAILED